MDNSHLTLEGGSIAKLYLYSRQTLDKVTKNFKIIRIERLELVKMKNSL
jgi:hypothetical protein